MTTNALMVLRVRGATAEDALRAVTGVSADDVTSLRDSGLVESTKRGLRLTEVGRAAADDAFEVEREALGAAAIDVTYESFCVINNDVKQIVTDWQLKAGGDTPVLNDHTDQAYDRAVLNRLAQAQQAFAALVERSGRVGQRLDSYRQRLAQAMAQINAGDVSFVASPAKDSFHTAWFELHEELLHLSGRRRQDESLAGGA